MKRQINYALFLLFLLVVWLFFYTGLASYKTFVQEKEKTLRYALGGNVGGLILYDKTTGETWKYFETQNNSGKSPEEGWMRLYYKDTILPDEDGNSEAYTVTPQEMTKRQKRSIQLWMQKYKGATKEIGKTVEMKNLENLVKEQEEANKN